MTMKKGVFLILFGHFLMNVKGDCGNLTIIGNTYNNATGSGPFQQGYVVQYSCNTGFTGQGSRVYVCSGSNFVGNFICIRNCGRHDHPINGRIVGYPEYKVGTRINFACNDGYEMQGSSSLLCRIDGNWRPRSAPTCKPVDCGPYESILNGYLFQESPDGIMNDYKSVVDITCDEGYVLQGSPTVTCLASGSWSPKPSCKPSDCGQHPAMKTNCIADSDLSSDGSILTILCLDSTDNRSVNTIGSGSAFCFDNQWDELGMGCICDCTVDKSIPGVVYHKLLGDKFVRHNTTLMWDCELGFSKNNMSNIICNDGEMKKPLCARENVTIDDPDIKCEPKHWVPIVLCFVMSVIHAILFLNYLVQWSLKHEKDKKYNNFTWWYWLLMVVGIVIAIILCIVAGSLVQRCNQLEHIHLKVGHPFETWQWVVMIFGILIIFALDVAILVVIEKFTDKGEIAKPGVTIEENVPLSDKASSNDKHQ